MFFSVFSKAYLDWLIRFHLSERDFLKKERHFNCGHILLHSFLLSSYYPVLFHIFDTLAFPQSRAVFLKF
jgi:hypothetical protein